MMRLLVQRLLHAVPVLFAVTLFSFLLIRLAPGDPVKIMLGIHATPSAVAFWHQKLDLNRPLPVQYLLFLRSIVTLNFGESISFQQPVTELIGSRIGTTLALMGFSLLISIVVSIPLATIAALRANGPTDHSFKVLMMAMFAMPPFWIGLSLVQIFTLKLGWLPASGLGQGFGPYVESLILPSVTIALFTAPVLFRALRATMVETLRAEHVMAARARGLSEPRILARYVLRNSLTSTVTMLGLTIGSLIAGTVIVENVFALPGLGNLIVSATAARDFPVIRVLVLLIGVWIILANLLADLANAWLNPQVRT
jgi:peptide/nickel transport system permease protein